MQRASDFSKAFNKTPVVVCQAKETTELRLIGWLVGQVRTCFVGSSAGTIPSDEAVCPRTAT